MEHFANSPEGFWLTNTVVKGIWGQSDDNRVRPTNTVKEWHNGLHSQLTSRRPELAVTQYSDQNGIQALLLDALVVACSQAAQASHWNQ